MVFFEDTSILNTSYEISKHRISDITYATKTAKHYFIELLYVTQGELFLNIDGSFRCLQKHYLAIIPDRSVHQLRARTCVPVKYIVMRFHLNAIKLPPAYLPLMRKALFYIFADEHYAFPPNMIRQTPIYPTIQRLVQDAEKQQFGYELEICSGLTSILLELLRCLTPSMQDADCMNDYDGTDFFSNILDYIGMHIEAPPSPKDLAEKCGLSYSRFSAKFKETFGQSCKNYIEYVQVLHAHELIVYSDFDFPCIAQKSGFPDELRLRRTYQKFRQQTPRQVRRCARAQMQS